MKLAEALSILNRSAELTGPPFRLFLACGFEPLHLRTLLRAHLIQRMPGRRVEVKTGYFGDIEGNIERAKAAQCEAVAVCIEWSDLDPRLDLRSAGGWQPSALDELASGATARGERLRQSLTDLAERTRVVLSLPGLPLPPLSFEPGSRTSAVEAGLHCIIAQLTEQAVAANVSVVNAGSLDHVSPMPGRLDVKSALITGFPYSLAHTSMLAEHMTALLHPLTPKKGLITDLDGTVWRGVLGEDGADGVSWGLEHHSQIHGLYQRTLAALAETGVLLGVVTKNDPDLTRKALARADLLVPMDRLFPVEASWGFKSHGVERILQAWNTGAENIVFVDDSPWEIAEVQRAFPQMECLRFPVDDAQEAYALLFRLRDMFGKSSILAEDSIRVESLKQQIVPSVGQPTSRNDEMMLREVDAKIDLVTQHDSSDRRALDLINKTNQFNLNGRRLTESEFESKLRRSGALFLMCSYTDKFGPLGRIFVLLGQRVDTRLTVDCCVMSCRAFSRRIEYAAFDYVFEHLGVEEIVLDFEETPRNGPLREFLASVVDAALTSRCRLSRGHFRAARPALFHTLAETARG